MAAVAVPAARTRPDVDPTDPTARRTTSTTSPANRAPRVAGSGHPEGRFGRRRILAIGLTHLLQNAADPDGDALSVKNLAASAGTLTPVPGGWMFQASPQWPGPVTLTYQITDGTLSVDQTATLLRRRRSGCGRA